METAPAAVALPARSRRRRTHVIQPRRIGVVGTLRESFSYRWCVPYFGRLYLRKRYQRTWLGFAWILIKPGFNMVTKIMVFKGILNVGTGKVPYVVFFLIAQASWQLFQEISIWATRSLEIGRNLLQRIELPKLPMVFGAIVPGSIEFFVYAGAAAAAVAYYVVRAGTFYLHLGWWTILTPLGLLLIILQGVGVGLVTSGASARARDVRYSLHFALGFLYFATPVVYPLSQIPPNWRPVAELNPVTGSLEMVKDGLFHSHELTGAAAAVAVGGTAILWALGYALLRRSLKQRQAA